ncbi:MAG TPA: ATP-binding protein [Blastocatellia bacterium]|nr:ATP-binding protein [Blastocatellia bacterium]
MFPIRRNRLLQYSLTVLAAVLVFLSFSPRAIVQAFETGDFMPHGMCYLWDPTVVWINAVSDALIGLSYVAISATLSWLVHRARRDIPFTWVFIAFGLFIVACGGTHFMEVWTLWTPTYWLSADVKMITAVASVATAVALPPLVPKTLAMIQAARLSEERRQKLESTNRELEQLYDRLRELDELKTQFFANVSHELRTPLALVLGPAQKLLGDERLTDRQRRDLEVIDRNARTLLKHVNDLLDVSRLEAGRMEVRYAETDLARLVRFVAAHFEVLAEERHIAFSIETPESVPVEADADQIQRVVLNLLSNAFKFTPAGGRVSCTLRREGARAIITVNDSGPGVRPELREAIFERFRQGDGGATRRFGGTGLGLSITREFVELHGGTIIVGDAPEGGASFTVTLPLSAPAGASVQAAPADTAQTDELARQALDELRSRVEAVAIAQEADRPLVLVIEDNLEMNRFLAEMLATEYRVATAFDGEEGLQQALSLKPDLILTDVMMPQMSGDQVVREVRARAELDAIPVVLLTAKADDELRARLLREGAQDYVMKPFSVEELHARVGNLVTMKRAREVLQQELATQLRDLEALARETTFRKRELQSALEAMRVARDQAEQASRVKSDFIRMVSHELRTPLNSINGYLQILQRQPTEALTATQRQIVERIAGSSARLLDLIESLLEYARIQSGRLQITVGTFDAAAVAAEAVEDMRAQAERRGLELRFQPEPNLPPLRSDARLVRLIMTNLVSNAVKYTERGTIEVSVSCEDGAHRIAVRDTGPGIPAEQQALIFEPFEQLQQVNRKHAPGFGLGLAIVRQMVEALGGRIELESQPGTGSTFIVILPPAESAQAPG